MWMSLQAMSAQWAQCGIGFVADYLVPKWDELFRADSEAAGAWEHFYCSALWVLLHRSRS